MVERETPAGEAEATPAVPERRQTLTAALRKELLAELAGAIGEGAVIDGDKVIVEAGQDVALYGRVEPDGAIVLTWWMTATTPQGHPRWRDAATALLEPHEAIHTSALGGGFLVEVEHRAATPREAARVAQSRKPVERVRALVAAFPSAVAALPPEPVPEYLLPQRDLT